MAYPGTLALADEHIADAERRIDRQRQLIAELQRDGHDTKEAQSFLETMQKLLEQMMRHRDYLARLASQPGASRKGRQA
jgi:hypothetical protein